jgi:hypothetical protein
VRSPTRSPIALPGARRVRRAVLAILMLSCFAATAPAAELPADPRVRAWQTGLLAPDRLRHTGLSFVLASALSIATDRPALALGVTFGAGLAKESLDRRRTRFDPVDLCADAIGIAAAAFVAKALER